MGSARVSFIFVTLLLDALGVGIIIPVLPDIIRRFNPNPDFVSTYFGYFISVYALMQFVASPVLGSLSDRFGRRPVLLVSLVGAGLDYLVMAFSPTLLLLFVGRVLAGLSGASMTVANAYMADVSTDENRSANFGMIGAAFGIGFILGPSLGGILGHIGPQAPFVAAAAMNLLNFAFGYFVLPESLPRDKRRPISWQALNPLRSLAKYLAPGPICLFICANGMMMLAGQSHPSIWTLYTQHKFQWTAVEVGFSLSFVGLVIGLAQGGLTRIIIPKLGEWRSLMFGTAFYVVGFGLFAVATAGWMMYGIMVLFAFSGVAVPALQSMLSKRVDSANQGELQGTLISVASLSAVAGPILYTTLFSHYSCQGMACTNAVYFPGAPYLAAALFSLLAVVVVSLVPRKM